MRSEKMAINVNAVRTQSMFLLNTIKENIPNADLKRLQRLEHFFHKVKFRIQKAFCIAFEITCTTKSISSTQAAKRYGITQKTSWLFMQKVRLAMKSAKQYPMTGNVQVYEFVVGGKETRKQGRSNFCR